MDIKELTNNFATNFSLDEQDTTALSKEETQLVRTSASERAHVWESKPWLACQEGRDFELQWYLDHSSVQEVSRFVHGRDGNGNTALIVACAATHLHGACANIIQRLLKEGADINTKNQDGRTALMEASLWGGLAAVNVLLSSERVVPANANLSDNSGLKAIELASKNACLVSEREKRCDNGENVLGPYDEKFRKRIVERLQNIRTEDVIPNYPICKFTSRSMEDSEGVYKAQVDRFNAKLSEAQVQLKQAESLATERLAELDRTKEDLAVMEARLKKMKSHCRVQKGKLDTARAELHNAKITVRNLSQRRANNADEEPRFRQTRLSENPTWIKFDFIQTFDVRPKYQNATMAYMKLGEKHHFAKNGNGHDAENNILSGRDYTTKACSLFRHLGFEGDDTWFQHAEPQLMALCIEHFRDSTGLTLPQFTHHQPIEPAPDVCMPELLEIFVSRTPCDTCTRLAGLMNLAANWYNFQVSLVHSSC